MAKQKSEPLEIKKDPTRGILLMAFGHSSYGKWAYNMAVSLRHYSPELNIHLVAEESVLSDIDQSVFSSVDTNAVLPYRITGGVDPAAAKTMLNEFSPYDQTIYLDVDGIAIQDITPLFDRIFSAHSVFFQVMGKGGRQSDISYMWVQNGTAWEHFKLKEDAVFCTSQTSIVAFDRSEQSQEFFRKLAENYRNKIPQSFYSIQWGPGAHTPDEVYFSGTAAQMDIVPDINIQPIFFPREHRKDLGNIQSEFTILSMWGARNHVRPFAKDWYDRLMHSYLASKGGTHVFKAHKLYDHKFSGRK